MFYRYSLFERPRNTIEVFYDKKKDNDATLIIKLKNAYAKSGRNIGNLNKDLQLLKKHKSFRFSY